MKNKTFRPAHFVKLLFFSFLLASSLLSRQLYAVSNNWNPILRSTNAQCCVFWGADNRTAAAYYQYYDEDRFDLYWINTYNTFYIPNVHFTQSFTHDNNWNTNGGSTNAIDGVNNAQLRPHGSVHPNIEEVREDNHTTLGLDAQRGRSSRCPRYNYYGTPVYGYYDEWEEIYPSELKWAYTLGTGDPTTVPPPVFFTEDQFRNFLNGEAAIGYADRYYNQARNVPSTPRNDASYLNADVIINGLRNAWSDIHDTTSNHYESWLPNDPVQTEPAPEIPIASVQNIDPICFFEGWDTEYEFLGSDL